MAALLVLNTILCVAAFFGSFGLQMGMGYAWEKARRRGRGGFANVLALGAFIFFGVPVVSVVGSWWSHLAGNDGQALVFVALPWVYLVMLIAGIAVLEKA